MVFVVCILYSLYTTHDLLFLIAYRMKVVI